MREVPLSRLQQLAFPLINYSETAYCRWNSVKNRLEFWQKHSPRGSAAHWQLFQAWPAIKWVETFLVDPNLVNDYFRCDLSWLVNANPAPNDSNYTPTNEPGGGLELLTDGNTPGIADWVAQGWGGNYPTGVDYSPHLSIVTQLITSTSIRRLMGLVGATNKPGNGVAFPALLTFPYDGIYVNCDTADSPCTRIDVVKDGVLQDQFTLATAPTTDHHHMGIVVNDAGDRVQMRRDGVIECTLDCSSLAGVQLQPYIMIMTNVNAVRSIHLHEFRLIMDEVL